jgi:di/tricarboxylate transporter
VGGDHRRLYHQLDVPLRTGAEPAGAGAGEKHVGINISWGTWFLAFLPLGILLILTMPLLAYWFYPPEVKVNNEVPLWATRELEKLGKLSRNEILLLVFVCLRC